MEGESPNFVRSISFSFQDSLWSLRLSGTRTIIQKPVALLAEKYLFMNTSQF